MPWYQSKIHLALRGWFLMSRPLDYHIQQVWQYMVKYRVKMVAAAIKTHSHSLGRIVDMITALHLKHSSQWVKTSQNLICLCRGHHLANRKKRKIMIKVMRILRISAKMGLIARDTIRLLHKIQATTGLTTLLMYLKTSSRIRS